MNYKKYFWIVLISTTFLRLLIIGQLGLGDDEGHYFTFSQRPELSYFDHPPAIGYIIKYSTKIFGINEFAVRFPAVLLFFLTCLFTFILASSLYNQAVGFFSVLLLNVTPVFSFLGSVLTVPDAPLAFCWVLFIYLFWSVMHGGPRWYWYALGAVLGFGLLSKYNAILLVPSMFMFFICAKHHRFSLKNKEPYISLFIGFVIFLPVIIWNLQNGWASFGYQLQHGFGKVAPTFSFTLLGRCLGAQAGYISPFLFFIFWIALVRMCVRFIKGSDERSLFLFCFSFPTLILFNAIASFNEILPHWPAMGYMVLAIGVAELTVELWKKDWFKVVTSISWVFGLLLTILVPLQAMFKLIPPELLMPRGEASRIEEGIAKAEKADVTNELYGWDRVGKEIQKIIRLVNTEKIKDKISSEIDDLDAKYFLSKKVRPPFIFTHRHYLSSQLQFYVPGDKLIYCFSERIDAYDFWQRDIGHLEGRDAIFVSNSRFYADPTKIYPFESWKAYKPIEIFRRGRKIRKFWLWYGKNFQPFDMPKAYTTDALSPVVTWQEGLIKLDHAMFWFFHEKLRFIAVDYVMVLFSFAGNGIPLAFIVAALLWFLPVLEARLKKPDEKASEEELRQAELDRSIWGTSERRKRFIKEFLVAFGIVLVGGIIVHVFKEIFARVRPLTLWEDTVRVLGPKLYRTSFPSGHTQASFSAAAILSYEFKKYWWAFFLGAVFVGISRVYIGVHFPFDVLAGAVIGVVSAYLLLQLKRR